MQLEFWFGSLAGFGRGGELIWTTGGGRQGKMGSGGEWVGGAIAGGEGRRREDLQVEEVE